MQFLTRTILFFVLQYFGLFSHAQTIKGVLRNLEGDSTKNESIKQRLKSFLNHEKNTLKRSITSQLPTNFIDSGKHMVTELIGSKVKLLTNSKPIKIEDVTFRSSYNYASDSSNQTPGSLNRLNGMFDAQFDGGVIVAGIPLSTSFSSNNGFNTVGQSGFRDFYSANFDMQKYREILQKQVLSKIKPEVILQSITSRINEIRGQYENQLKSQVKHIKDNFSRQFNAQLDLPVDIGNISKPDFSDLTNRILQSDVIEKYNENKVRYQQILSSSNIKLGDTAITNQLLKEIKGYEAVQEVYSKVLESKSKFEENSVVKTLKSHLPFTPDSYASFLKDPKNLKEIIKNYASLSTLQNLFLRITKLDLGQNPVQNGEFSMKGLMNTGINTSIQNGKSNFGFIAGKNNNVNTWLQTGLSSFATNEYSGMAGMMLGNESVGSQALSLSLYSFSQTPGAGIDGVMQPLYMAPGKRKDAVISFHKELTIGGKHNFEIDASKSFGSYSNMISNEGTADRKGVIGSLLGNEGKMNYAVSVDYIGDVLNTGLQLSVKKVGLGYNNPGNVFLRKGESQVRMALIRKALKGKFTLNYSMDYRNQNFDPERKFIYTTFSNKLQVKLRLNRNSRIGISYQQSNYQYVRTSQPVSSSISSMLQTNGSYRFKLLRKSVSNTISLNRNIIKLPLTLGNYYSSSSLLLVHTSTVVVKGNLLMLSITGNHSNNQDYYYNTSFLNSEINYVFSLLPKMSLTSGGGYYINNGWNKQVGIRQQVSMNILKRMDVDIGFDVRRAVKVTKTELANQQYINSSVYYRF